MKSRNLKLSIRVTSQEQTEVNELAHKLSLSVSNYGRKKLLGEPLNQVIIPEVNIKTYEELVNLKNQVKAVGQNLNQVVKVMHIQHSVPPNLVATIAETNSQIAQAVKILNRLQLLSIGINVK
jgi:predicted membrane chloride channel (bestrophin family)